MYHNVFMSMFYTNHFFVLHFSDYSCEFGKLRKKSNLSLFSAIQPHHIFTYRMPRQQISLTLHSMAKFESKQLLSAIETLNSTLVANMTSHYTLSHVTPKDSLYEITPYLSACGLTQPLLQVYNTFKVRSVYRL